MDGGCVGVSGTGVSVGGCSVAVGGIGVGGTGVAVAGSGVAVGAADVCGMGIVVGGCESVQALIMTTKVKSGSGHRIMFLFMPSAPCWVRMFLSARVGRRSHRPLPGVLSILPHPPKNGPFALQCAHHVALQANTSRCVVLSERIAERGVGRHAHC